jgi:hypothetical protein
MVRHKGPFLKLALLHPVMKQIEEPSALLLLQI